MTGKRNINIVSWNCQGKLDFIFNLINLTLFDIAHISETHHTNNTVLKPDRETLSIFGKILCLIFKELTNTNGELN